MIITHDMFESFNGCCPKYREGLEIAPLPDSYSNVCKKLIKANREDLLALLEMRKPQLIVASGDYDILQFRLQHDLIDNELIVESMPEVINTIESLRDQYLIKNNDRLGAVEEINNSDGSITWNVVDINKIKKNIAYRVYDCFSGENVFCAGPKEAKDFIDLMKSKIKESMPLPTIHKKIKHKEGKHSGWLLI